MVTLNQEAQERHALVSLAHGLDDQGIDCHLENGLVRPGTGTVELRLQEVSLCAKPAAFMAHIAIESALNPKHPQSFITEFTTGIGNTETAAIDDAVMQWMLLAAPPLFSVLNCKPVMSAEWFPDGDSLGIAGWDVFSSPYVLRGDQRHQSRLEQYLQDAPLLTTVAAEIATCRLRPLFNYIKLYWGFDGSAIHADCRINGTLWPDLSDKLSTQFTPNIDSFASVAQFCLLLGKNPKSRT